MVFPLLSARNKGKVGWVEFKRYRTARESIPSSYSSSPLKLKRTESVYTISQSKEVLRRELSLHGSNLNVKYLLSFENATYNVSKGSETVLLDNAGVIIVNNLTLQR